MEKYPDWFDKNADFYYGDYLKYTSATNSQTSFKEGIKKAQIPKELYKAMTTEQLFDAMNELLKREDVAKNCCDRYLNRDFTNKVDKYGVANREGQVYLEVGILLRESSYKKLDETQRTAVLEKFRENIKDYPYEQLGGSTKGIVQMEFDNLNSEKSNSWANKFK